MGILLFLLVYIPRIVMFIIMRQLKRSDNEWRLKVFKVRALTWILQILFLFIGVIGSGAVLGASKQYLTLQCVPSLVGYLLAMLWAVTLDLLFTILHKRYYEKGKSKTGLKHHGNSVGMH